MVNINTLNRVREIIGETMTLKDLHPENSSLNALIVDFALRIRHYLKPTHPITHPANYLRVLSSEAVLIVGELIYQAGAHVATIAPTASEPEILESTESLHTTAQAIALESMTCFVKHPIENSRLCLYEPVKREVFY